MTTPKGPLILRCRRHQKGPFCQPTTVDGRRGDSHGGINVCESLLIKENIHKLFFVSANQIAATKGACLVSPGFDSNCSGIPRPNILPAKVVGNSEVTINRAHGNLASMVTPDTIDASSVGAFCVFDESAIPAFAGVKSKLDFNRRTQYSMCYAEATDKRPTASMILERKIISNFSSLDDERSSGNRGIKNVRSGTVLPSTPKSFVSWQPSNSKSAFTQIPALRGFRGSDTLIGGGELDRRALIMISMPLPHWSPTRWNRFPSLSAHPNSRLPHRPLIQHKPPAS